MRRYFASYQPLKAAMLVITVTLTLACGGADGGSSPRIRILSPDNGSSFSQGDMIPYTLETESFVLMSPLDHKTLELKHHSEDGDNHHTSEDENLSDPMVEDHHDDSNHASEEVNPYATEGHYHIYLDDASGADEHSTAWTYSGTYALPADIAPGEHSLRFELRDNNHIAVGAVNSETVLTFMVNE